MKPAVSCANMLTYEDRARQEGYCLVCGVDEAGRGPLAGPVVAAAVLLREYQFDNRIADSKKLSPTQREKAFLEIYDKACVGVGIINEKVIDEQNILRATFHAMTHAVLQLISRFPPEVKKSTSWRKDVCLLVDGDRFKTDLPYAFRTIIKGDNLSLSIAAASIVAKVTRDRILSVYDQIYPEYGFCQHKGYGTEIHRTAITKHGPSPIHRRTFIGLHEPVSFIKK